MTDRQLLITAVFTLVLGAILVVTVHIVRRNSQFRTILSTVVGLLSLIAAVLQFALAMAPSNSDESSRSGTRR